MKQHVCLVILVTATILVGAGSARATDDFNRPGPYVGLGAAGGLSEFHGPLRDAGDSLGFNFRGGYRFNDYMAIEGLYEYMDEFGKTVEGPTGNQIKTHLGTNNFSAMAKVLFPTLGLSNLQPFVSGGIGFLNANGTSKLKLQDLKVRGEASGTEFAGRVDGGVDYFFTPEISTFFDLGYVIPTRGLSDLNYLSLSAGVKYNF
jgi:Outer membrane protein beta-barrel domain